MHRAHVGLVASLLVGALVSLVLGETACRRGSADKGGQSAVPTPRSLRAAFDDIAGAGGPAHVELFTNPASAWAARWEMLRSAQQSVDASYYIAEEDAVGLAFLGQLALLAGRGVRVRLLVDRRGSDELSSPAVGAGRGRDWLEELAAVSPAAVAIYNPAPDALARAAAAASLLPALASSHKKMLVVDGALALTGGRNLGVDYYAAPEESAEGFLDTDVRFDGPPVARAVADIDADFAASAVGALSPDVVNVSAPREALELMAHAMDAWLEARVPLEPEGEAVRALEAAAAAAHGRPPTASALEEIGPRLEELARLRSLWGVLPLSPPPRHKATVRLVSEPSAAEGPGSTKPSRAIEDAVVTAIAGARRQIFVESPYVVLAPRVLAALERAARRGVPIVVSTNGPSSSDNAASQALFVDTWPELMARLPTLRLWVRAERPTLHAKRLVIDDDLVLVGTYNLDPLSARLNSEIVLAVWSPGFARENRREIERRLGDGGALEYRIERDEQGEVRRQPPGQPQEGEVIVVFGPAHHTPPAALARLEGQKGPWLALARAAGLDVVTW